MTIQVRPRPAGWCLISPVARGQCPRLRSCHEAVIGHPKHDAAYGWVKSPASADRRLSRSSGRRLRRAGGRRPLQEDQRQFLPARRPQQSGARRVLPAPCRLPGRPATRRKGSQAGRVRRRRRRRVVEFGDWGMETNASLWRRMREWLLAKFDQETADQVVPDWQIESIREAARQDDAPRAAFADPVPTPLFAIPDPNHRRGASCDP